MAPSAASARAAATTGAASPINGRSVDMIQRNYFAHPILNCGGRYVFSMMQAFGIRYQSAGENIGWNTYGDGGTAASQINSAFMNSPDHRSNILNGSYTALGIGSDNSGSAAWSGGGGSYTGAWMFSEEFAQMAGSPPPPPPPPPPPRPKPKPVTAPPTRNTAPPPPPTTPASDGHRPRRRRCPRPWPPCHRCRPGCRPRQRFPSSPCRHCSRRQAAFSSTPSSRCWRASSSTERRIDDRAVTRRGIAAHRTPRTTANDHRTPPSHR